MGKKKKSWTPQEKKAIVSYYSEHGIGVTCRQFTVSAPSVYKWAEQLKQSETIVLSGTRSIRTEAEFKKLERENKVLKTMIAERELELRIKKELLKKSK